MPSECSFCHEVAVEAEPGGELVCHKCGAIEESRVFSTEKDGNDGWTFVGTDGKARGSGRHDLPINARLRLPSEKPSVSKKGLQDCLYTQVKRLNLSNEILNKAKDLLFNRLLPMRGRPSQIRSLTLKRNILVGACVFIVCRQSNFQLTYRRMAEVAECDMFRLGRCVKIILKALDINLDPLSSESLVVCVLSELSVFDRSCEKLCLELCQILKYLGLSARNHMLNALSMVLLVLECKQLSPTKDKIAGVLGKNSLKQDQLGNEMCRTKTSLLELAKEVPWIPKSVKKPQIARHIVDIVNFHKKCGKMDLSVVKSLCMKKKEIAEKNRKVKIQSAKSRILSKKHGEPRSTASSETNSAALPSQREHQVSGCHGNDQESAETVTVESGSPHEMSLLPSTNNPSHVSSEGTSSNNCDGGVTLFSEDELDNNDILIEQLLQSGYTEEELMDGYFESRMCDLKGPEQPDEDREDLDELDIAEKEMHHYLWSVSEMERLKNLKSL